MPIGNYERASQMMGRIVAARWEAETMVAKLKGALAGALEILDDVLANWEGIERWMTPEQERKWSQALETLKAINMLSEGTKP